MGTDGSKIIIFKNSFIVSGTAVNQTLDLVPLSCMDLIDSKS